MSPFWALAETVLWAPQISFLSSSPFFLDQKIELQILHLWLQVI